MSTVKEDDTPFVQEIVRENDLPSANLAHFQAREHISRVEKLDVRFWHSNFLLSLQASHREERLINPGGSCYEGTNITGEKAVKDARTKLNDALMESWTGIWGLDEIVNFIEARTRSRLRFEQRKAARMKLKS